MLKWDRNKLYWEAVMLEIIMIGLDLAKNVVQGYAADSKGIAVLRERLRPCDPRSL